MLSPRTATPHGTHWTWGWPRKCGPLGVGRLPGGKLKTYELQVDFNKLLAYGLTLPQLIQILNNSNINVGGNTVNIGPQAAVVRGVGLIRSIEELNNTMLAQTLDAKTARYGLVGSSPALLRALAELEQVSQASVSVLLLGESHSSKVARNKSGPCLPR